MSCCQKNKMLFSNINRPQRSYFSFFEKKMVSLKVVHPLEIYRNTKFHVPTLSGASFAFISQSEV
jgi:hypothetical protein